ncbi:hypothetical protein BHE74_00022903 [Ensete ventricosum]|nr:hypothetical protein GW17_00014010 [Ensete ventricosum]RWW69486.1 hypothetical protein BHE74_00022903 [Ensete ventricosum]RZR92537.1 hypothetical protein BHM03_00020849 [Ensete ventricosum]
MAQCSAVQHGGAVLPPRVRGAVPLVKQAREHFMMAVERRSVQWCLLLQVLFSDEILSRSYPRRQRYEVRCRRTNSWPGGSPLESAG